MDAASEGRRIVGRWFGDVFTRGNLAAVDEICAEDLVVHAPGEDPAVHGVENFKDWLRWYRETFTDAEWTVHDVIAAGDRVVARACGRVTYRGGLLGIPSDDQRITESGITIFRVEGVKVAEIWPEMSDLQVVVQLGAFPGPDREG